MPRYRVTLDNGKALTVESDHPPTEDEINDSYGQWQKEQQQPSRTRRPRVEAPDPELAEPHENKTSFLGTAAREAALGLIPTYAAKEAAEAAMGALIPTGPWGMGIGGILAGGTVGGLADVGEEKLLNATVPDFMKEVETGRQEHPRAAALGRFGVGLGLFRPDYKTIPNAIRSLKYWRTGTAPQRKLVTDAARNLAIGAASGVAIPALHGHMPTAEDVITGAAQAGLYGRPYKWTNRISPGSAYLRSRIGGLVEPTPPTPGTPDASGQQEATTVHEPVSPPTGQGERQVPTAPSGERVQPVTPPVGEETQVPLEAQPPQITGNEKFGFTITHAGRTESGFETRQEAEDFFHEVQAGRQQLKYEEGQPQSREDLEATKRAEVEYQKSKEAQGGITEEEAEHRDAAERAAIDHAEEGHTLEPGTSDENVPYAWSRMGRGHFLEALGGKRIAINREELRQWAGDRYHDGFSKEEIQNMMKARMDEEVEHGKFIDAAGGMAKANVLAERFWNTLTAAEKGVVNRKYLGKWGRGKRPPSAMGHEAVRMIRQRARGAPEGDILETMTLENLGLKGISVLSETLRRFREKVGTKAAREGQAILDATQEKAGDPTTEPTSGGPGATKKDRDTLGKIRYLEGKAAQFRAGGKEKEAVLAETEADRLKKELPPKIGPRTQPELMGEQYLAEPGKLPSVAWMRPDGKIIDVIGSKDLPPAHPPSALVMLRSVEPDTKWNLDTAMSEFRGRNYLRLVRDLGDQLYDTGHRAGVLYVDGRPTQAQLRELNSLAAEHSVELRNADTDRPLSPGARRKPSEKDEPLLFQNLKKSGEQAEPGKMVKPVPPEERKVEVPPLTEEQIQAASRPLPGPEALREVVLPQIKAQAPSYDAFYDALEKAFGKRAAEEMGGDLFEDLTWKELLSATPERLAQLISSYRLGPKIGIKKLPRMREEDIARINDPQARQEARKQMEMFKGKQPELSGGEVEKLVNRIRGNKSFRSTVISTIARDMFKDMTAAEEASYRKKSVEFEDIDLDNPKGKPSGYHEFTPGESNSPKLLSEILSNRGRGGSRAPVSASYRLVALRNRVNGKVELVSAYDDFRRGVVVYRPGRNMYVPIAEVDPNLKFFATLLLNDPLQQHEQYFKNTDDFQRHFDSKNAERLSKGAVVPGTQKQAVAMRPGEGTEGRETLERLLMAGTEGAEGKEGVGTRALTGREVLGRFAGTGGVQGPESDLIAAMRGLGAGELEKAVSGDSPLTGPEASSLHKVLGEMDVTEPEDMKEMLYLLDGMAQRGRLEGRHYQAYAALYKLAGAIQRAAAGEAVETTHPLPADRLPLTPDKLHDATLQAAYELFKKHSDREKFTLDALLNFGWEPSRLGEPVSKTPVPHVEAEGTTLEMLKRRPPTDVAGLPPGEPREMTTANPGIIPGPETLAPEAQAAVEAYAQNLTFKKEQGSPALGPYQPTKPFKGLPVGPGEYGGPRFTKEPPKGEPKEFPFEASHSFEATKWHIKTKPQTKSNVPTWTKSGQGKLDLSPPEGGPGAINRRAQEVYDALAVLKRSLTVAADRGLTKKDLTGHADGVHRLSESYSIRNGESIKWQSIPDDAKATKAEKAMWRAMADRPEYVKVRKAVVPWNAALSIRNDAVRYEVYQAWEKLKAKEAQDKKDRIAAAKETGDEAAIEKAKDEHPSIYRDPADEPRYVRPTRPLPEDFDPLILSANKGIANATDAMRSDNIVLRRMGKKALKGAEELKELAVWAKHNLDHPELERTAQQFRDVMDQHLQLMLTEGSNIAARDFYVPDRFGGEAWDDGMMAWGEQRFLGTNQRLPRVFKDYYDAIQAQDKQGRMYYPVNLDVAELAQHSLVRGMRRIAWLDWANILIGTKDPSSPGGKETVAIATDLVPVHKMVRNAAGVMEQQTVLEPQIPAGKQEYEIVRIGGPKGTAIAVREGYRPLVEMMMEESRVPNMPGGKPALATAHALKHGFILLGDTFHLGRLWQYATALGGKNWFEVKGRPGWKSGYSALTWHPEDIQRAVKAGLITEQAAKWALEPIKLYDGNVIRNMTRHEVGSIYLSLGLNANRSADFMYRNAVKAMPVIGPWWYQHLVDKPTKFLFDRYTPGLILEMAVRNLERQNAGDRKTPLLRQMRYIARDTNAFFGNMGRQGFFKNPTFRDLSQFAVLAPLWQEGLLRKEFTAAYRLASGVKYLKGGQSRSFEAHLGPITFGVMRGLGMYFILTQAINLMTKRQFTWQNQEEGHKMDAWLPNGFGSGIWISPMSVFAETAHEFIRLYQSKATAMETAARLGLNKAGPLGRMANVLWTQQTPGGEHTTSTADTAWAAAQELMPLPISVGAGVKELAYQAGAGRILPGVTPSKPGTALQRGMSLVGVKSELGRRAEDDIARLADKFLVSEGLKYQPLQMVPTTDPTYAKLRGAIKNKDFGGAKRILNGLRQHRTDEQIVHAMKLASTRPFTGSHKAENLFLYSLTDYQQDLYSKAQENRAAIYQDFLEWFTNQ